MGERAFLLELGSPAEVLALHRRLQATRPPGVVDLVPAAGTVLVRIDPAVISIEAARAWAMSADAETLPGPTRSMAVDLDITYDGADLDETAALLGLSPDELVRRHTETEWTVAFTGFAPGFGYLVSPEWPFDVPRLPAPRTRVPAGAVGLAGVFSGAYPRETPGGWRLIGTTSATLFDPGAADPALLAPGTRVRFRPTVPATGARGAGGGRSAGHRSAVERPLGDERPGLRVVEPGLLATVQDLGRPGAASLGVAPSGAADRGALRTANRLVGNSEGAAGIEVTMGGFRAVAEQHLWVAVTGAWGPVHLGGREIDPYVAHEWMPGVELRLDWFTRGARAYVAARGGIDAPGILGSRSTDTLAALGRPALRAGDSLALADDQQGPVPPAPPVAWGPPPDDEITLDLADGPRVDWFTEDARAALFDAVWTVTNDADRVGVRLDGPLLARSREGEIASEGMVPGAVQVPPSGQPTVLFADGPVTGGYPVIAVVTAASLDLLAQARPGTLIRFRHARP
ncbi:urea amidolyase family protein [Microbacterium koreense]